MYCICIFNVFWILDDLCVHSYAAHVSDVILYCEREIVHVIMLPLTSLSEGLYGAESPPKHSLSVRMTERSAYPKPLFGDGTLPLLEWFNLSQGSIQKSESIFHTGRFLRYGNVSLSSFLSLCVWVCEFTVCILG